MYFLTCTLYQKTSAVWIHLTYTYGKNSSVIFFLNFLVLNNYVNSHSNNLNASKSTCTEDRIGKVRILKGGLTRNCVEVWFVCWHISVFEMEGNVLCNECLAALGVRNKRQRVPVNTCSKSLLLRSAQPKHFKTFIALQTSTGISSVWGIVNNSQELSLYFLTLLSVFTPYFCFCVYQNNENNWFISSLLGDLLLCFFLPRVYFKTCNTSYRSEARCLARWLRYIKRISITMWLRRRRHCFLWGSHPNTCFFWYVFIPVTVGDLFKIPFSRVYNLDWKLTFFKKQVKKIPSITASKFERSLLIIRSQQKQAGEYSALQSKQLC